MQYQDMYTEEYRYWYQLHITYQHTFNNSTNTNNYNDNNKHKHIASTAILNKCSLFYSMNKVNKMTVIMSTPILINS